jgi:hypothetical protein
MIGDIGAAKLANAMTKNNSVLHLITFLNDDMDEMQPSEIDNYTASYIASWIAIKQECTANKVFKDDRNKLFEHCAVLAEVVVVKRTITMFIARSILAELAGGEKFTAELYKQLDDLVFDNVVFDDREKK